MRRSDDFLRVHTMLLIGGLDMEAGAVSVRFHHGGPQGAKPKAELVSNPTPPGQISHARVS